MNPTTTQPGRAHVQPRYMGVEEAAIYLGRTEDALYTLVSRRRIPNRKDGRRLMFDRLALDAWMDGLEGVGVAEAVDRTLHGGGMTDNTKTGA